MLETLHQHLSLKAHQVMYSIENLPFIEHHDYKWKISLLHSYTKFFVGAKIQLHVKTRFAIFFQMLTHNFLLKMHAIMLSTFLCLCIFFDNAMYSKPVLNESK